jgi:cysteinyl-tRNA synthetase
MDLVPETASSAEKNFARHEKWADRLGKFSFAQKRFVLVTMKFRHTASGKEATLDDVKSQMEGVTRLYQQLDEKITNDGGMQNLLGMNRKIRQALESISIGDIDNMLNEIHRAKEGLTRLQEDMVEIRVLKEILAASRPVNGAAR